MIIWGSKARERQIGSGTLFCPNCQVDSPYSHLRVSRYFTLYFIPLFPTQTLGGYVKCGRCGGAFPEVILTCTRDEILKAIEPWTCPRCNNRNPRSEGKCIACGAGRLQPPPLPAGLQSGSPAPPVVAPPVIPGNAPARKPPGSGAKIAAWAACFVGVCVLGLIGVWIYQFVQLARHPTGPSARSEFYNATSEIGPHGKPASGNSTEATGLALKMALAMTILRDEQFTQSTKKSLIDQRDNFKVYCDLRTGQCVFLIHVPELRRFEGEAQERLGNLAWKTAQEVLAESKKAAQPVKLGVGMRGNLAYERVLVGLFTPIASGPGTTTTPDVEEGFGCERRLIDWFAPPATNSAPVVEAEAPKPAS